MGQALLTSPHLRARGDRDHLVLAGHSGLKYVDRGLQPPTHFSVVRMRSCGSTRLRSCGGGCVEIASNTAEVRRRWPT